MFLLHRMSVWIACLLLVFLILPPRAGAVTAGGGEYSPLYVGGSWGSSTVDDEEDVQESLGVSGTFNMDDNEDGWKIFMGYKFHPNLAIEAGYVNLGAFDYSGPFQGTLDIDGFQASAVGQLTFLERFYVYGRAGGYTWDGDEITRQGSVRGDDGTDVTYGLGGGYIFANEIEVRAEYEQYTIDSAETIDITLITGSFVFPIPYLEDVWGNQGP